MREPIKVAVLVEIFRRADAGGHVKCWERFAWAARSFSAELDLTVTFLGRPEQREVLAGNVRLEMLPPVFGTDRVPGLSPVAADTDLAPFHPALYSRLARYDVLHATGVFAFGGTVRRFARRRGKPLVTSVHDNLPVLTRAYAREIVERRLGRHVLAGLVLDRLHFDRACAAAMTRRLERLVNASEWVLVGRESDLAPLSLRLPSARVSRLRRGIDKERFHPRRRDRQRLAREFGVPEDRPLILFAGRIDESKNVMILAEAARRLLDRGVALHLLAVGKGVREAQLHALLGPRVTLPGPLPQETLARVYASADLFVFPSESEIMPNVVLEARASRLPVVLSARDNGAELVAHPGVDGVLVSECTPQAWAAALRPLLADPKRRAAMGVAARRWIENEWPDWRAVLAEDLLPVWRAAASRELR